MTKTAHPESISVTLQHPVEHEGKAVTSIQVRRPLVRDLLLAERRAAPGSEVAADVAILAECSGLPREALEKLALGDFRAVMLRARGAGFFGLPEGASDGTSLS